MRGAGGGDEAGAAAAGRAERGCRRSRRPARPTARRAAPARTSWAAASTFSTRPTMSSVVGARRLGYPVTQRARSRRCVHTGRGTSASTAASAQSSMQRGQGAVRVRAERQAGPRIQLPLDRFDRRRHAQPQQPAGAGPHRGVLLGLVGEHPQIHGSCPRRRSAGKPANGVAAAGLLDDARQLVEVVGPAAQSGAFQLAGDRVGDGLPGRRGEPFLQRREVLAPGHLGAVGGLDGERDPQMWQAACPGRRRRSARAPRCGGAVRAARHPAAVLGPGSMAASTARAVSGAGTKLRRKSFGSERISAVIKLLAQRGHLPGELVATQAREHVDRHVHGDAVVGGTRLEPVGQRQRQVARLPGVRPVGAGPPRCAAGRRG